MASLKEIKGRISSVQSTLKITSAMKLVASTKLRRAQTAIENMLPYDRQLGAILHNFLSSGVTVESPFTEERPIERVAVVVVASNSSLCGGFNSNVIRKANNVLEGYAKLGKENLLVYPVGRKVVQSLNKHYALTETYKMIGDKPAYKDASALAEHLMEWNSSIRTINRRLPRWSCMRLSCHWPWRLKTESQRLRRITLSNLRLKSW